MREFEYDTNNIKTTFDTEKNRLLSLIDFSLQSAKTRIKAVPNVYNHKEFVLFEHELQGLPGIKINPSDSENDDEIWMVIERLNETKAPSIDNPFLKPWIQISDTPAKEPYLLQNILLSKLESEKAQLSFDYIQASDYASKAQGNTIDLNKYEKADIVKATFEEYLNKKWRPWSDREKLRRKTIDVYSRLFTLMQKIAGSVLEGQLELVWGVGIGVWNFNGTIVKYPLITRQVELSLEENSAKLIIRPRDVEPCIELDWYASVDIPTLAQLYKAAKDFFSNAQATFSPFDGSTYKPLLQTAAALLDPQGIYWPDHTPLEDRSVPEPENNLKVTDTWVLFARPRSNNMFIHDLEELKKKVQETHHFPPSVLALVTDPRINSIDPDLPSFRGVSASYHRQEFSNAAKARDLYFPKPFNEEQVRIIQLLESNDGVVVQGPPGTGKTHTIANIICHYLAEGKRILVTSMKEPALAVLQQQLPDEIRPLAIALLTNEQDGMKQFEHSIQKIAYEIQNLDRWKTESSIRMLETTIDTLHSRLAKIDRQISDLAAKNLNQIILDNQIIDPRDAISELARNAGNYEIIPDDINIISAFVPQFSDDDIIRLREARRNLGPDIDYTDASLPQLAELPDSAQMLKIHQDLSHLERLKQDILQGKIPQLSDSTQETLGLMYFLQEKLAELRANQIELNGIECSWKDSIHAKLKTNAYQDLVQKMVVLGNELEEVYEKRKVFLEKPVNLPSGIELDDEIVNAVKKLAEGRKPFGLAGILAKAEKKKVINSIQVLGASPHNIEEWSHVHQYISLMLHMRELVLRWNAIAQELGLETVSENVPEGYLQAHRQCMVFLKLRAIVIIENEINTLANRVFPLWTSIHEISTNSRQISEIENAVRHHLAQQRLFSVVAEKERLERILQDRKGRIVQQLRIFIDEKLGNPDIDDARFQNEWAGLMQELMRVSNLDKWIADVREITSKIKASGAPQYAQLLQQPLEGTVDRLLPDNLRQIWRLRRLATWLASIDLHEDLREFAKERKKVEMELQKAYRDIAVNKTWLRVKENASPKVKSALQAYLAAIKKIGKGTGKRAVRYRKDAREAAMKANLAIPCWIMPHYRVSESMPPELGFFDLVIIDEASQSDLSALPALLRGKKILVVGDDKQVSPEGIGIEEEKVRSLMNSCLSNQVDLYRAQMSPERSIYDLYKVVFAQSLVMLKEHFRCVGPIIEYSKREFYNHELKPLRIPKASERLDPPLIDVLIEDGYRSDDINKPEALFIVNEIKAITNDPAMRGRSVGVVSLLGDSQAKHIWDLLIQELGIDVMERYRIACGDARTFQGNERDIMFLSMVIAPNNIGAALSRDTFAQRFNVAASRARDRMYLVRSVELEDLSDADKLRRSLIMHFQKPFAQDEARVENLRSLCESDFERELYDELVKRGYYVTPQVRVGQYRIDLVVEGHNDSRLAIECDGDKYHGPEKWMDDMDRQRNLERAGWVFWRCFASSFVRRREEVLEDLFATLRQRGIEPIGGDCAPRSVHTEHRRVTAASLAITEELLPDEVELEVRKSLPEPDSKLEFEPAIPEENKSPKPAKEERKISEPARKIETIKTHDNSAAKQVGAQNTHSSLSEIAIPQEASVWFSLASWAKENKYFDGRCRQFIFKVGLYYKKGWPLSSKMIQWAKDIWDESIKKGFDPSMGK